jgi:hypothetical protein
MIQVHNILSRVSVLQTERCVVISNATEWHAATDFGIEPGDRDEVENSRKK